jgi:hypothetical protein
LGENNFGILRKCQSSRRALSRVGGRVGFAPQAVCRCWWAERRTWRGQPAVLFLENETLFHEGEKYKGWPSIISWPFPFKLKDSLQSLFCLLYYSFNIWTLSIHDN